MCSYRQEVPRTDLLRDEELARALTYMTAVTVVTTLCCDNRPQWPCVQDQQPSNWWTVDYFFDSQNLPSVTAWTLIVCASVSSRRLPFWLLQVRTIRHSVGFSLSLLKYHLTSKSNDADFTTWIFRSNCRLLNGWDLVVVLRGWRFLIINISHNIL